MGEQVFIALKENIKDPENNNNNNNNFWGYKVQ